MGEGEKARTGGGQGDEVGWQGDRERGGREGIMRMEETRERKEEHTSRRGARKEKHKKGEIGRGKTREGSSQGDKMGQGFRRGR